MEASKLRESREGIFFRGSDRGEAIDRLPSPFYIKKLTFNPKEGIK
jgi:hypothetical protein